MVRVTQQEVVLALCHLVRVTQQEVKSSRWSIHEVRHKFWEGTLVNQEVLCKQDNRPLGHLQKRRRVREEKGNSRHLVLEVIP